MIHHQDKPIPMIHHQDKPIPMIHHQDKPIPQDDNANEQIQGRKNFHLFQTGKFLYKLLLLQQIN